MAVFQLAPLYIALYWYVIYPYLVLGAVGGVLDCLSTGDRVPTIGRETCFSHGRKGRAGRERRGDDRRREGGPGFPKEEAKWVSVKQGRGRR